MSEEDSGREKPVLNFDRVKKPTPSLNFDHLKGTGKDGSDTNSEEKKHGETPQGEPPRKEKRKLTPEQKERRREIRRREALRKERKEGAEGATKDDRRAHTPEIKNRQDPRQAPKPTPIQDDAGSTLPDVEDVLIGDLIGDDNEQRVDGESSSRIEELPEAIVLNSLQEDEGQEEDSYGGFGELAESFEEESKVIPAPVNKTGVVGAKWTVRDSMEYDSANAKDRPVEKTFESVSETGKIETITVEERTQEIKKKRKKKQARKIKNSKNKKYRSNAADLKGTIAGRGAREWLVSPDGVLFSGENKITRKSAMRFQKLVEASEKLSQEDFEEVLENYQSVMSGEVDEDEEGEKTLLGVPESSQPTEDDLLVDLLGEPGHSFEGYNDAKEIAHHIALTNSIMGIADGEDAASTVFPWQKGENTRQNILDVAGYRKRQEDKRKKGILNLAQEEIYKRFGSRKKNIYNNPELIENLRDGIIPEKATNRAAKIAREAAIRGHKSYRHTTKNETEKFNKRDSEFLEFMAKIGYAKAVHIGRALGTSKSNAGRRLNKLRALGLVDSFDSAGEDKLWFLTDAGMLISGYSLPTVKASSFSLSQVGHKTVVNSVAAGLWSGVLNTLNLDDFPQKNRVDTRRGVLEVGETLVTELQINSKFAKRRAGRTGSEYRPALIKLRNDLFREWEEKGGMNSGIVSPEMVPDNEYMWVLLPSLGVKRHHHVPDLVVARPRNKDGSPRSISVEVELSLKQVEEYEKILKAYLEDDLIYAKVIWVCAEGAVAKRIQLVAESIGMWETGKIDIVPVLDGEGNVFNNRDNSSFTTAFTKRNLWDLD